MMPQHDNTVSAALMNKFQFGLILKRGVIFQQGIEPPDIRNLIGCRAPVKTYTFVDIDFFPGKPFHAVGKAESAMPGTERAQSCPHCAVSFGACCKTVVVMGFGKMNQQSIALCNL